MNEKRFYHIYNMSQADFFIKNGIVPIGAGKGKKGDAYLLFRENDKLNKIFERWCYICKYGYDKSIENT